MRPTQTPPRYGAAAVLFLGLVAVDTWAVLASRADGLLYAAAGGVTIGVLIFSLRTRAESAPGLPLRLPAEQTVPET